MIGVHFDDLRVARGGLAEPACNMVLDALSHKLRNFAAR
jgi:hypothetical protein